MNQGGDAHAVDQRPGAVLRRRRPGTITYNTLTQAPVDTSGSTRCKLLDIGVQKVFRFSGGRTASS